MVGILAKKISIVVGCHEDKASYSRISTKSYSGVLGLADMFFLGYNRSFMRFFSRDKPKIKVKTSKEDGFSGWLK